MADLPMRYDTRYRWTGKGAEGWIDVEGLDALAVGSPHDAGRFSPEHLFVAAAEICMANFVTLIAERSGLDRCDDLLLMDWQKLHVVHRHVAHHQRP